jgi:hypothetical protein
MCRSDRRKERQQGKRQSHDGQTDLQA